MKVDVAGPFGSDLSARLGSPFGAMKVVRSPLAIDYRMPVVRHPIRKRRRNWTVQRQQRPGIFVSEVLRTIYVHPDVYDKWTSGMYRRGDWVPNDKGKRTPEARSAVGGPLDPPVVPL